MNYSALDDFTPGELCVILKEVRAVCERKEWLRYTTLSYLYTAMAQLEVVQQRLDKLAAKAEREALKAQEQEVTVSTVPTVEEEAQPLKSEADEILKRLLQS